MQKSLKKKKKTKTYLNKLYKNFLIKSPKKNLYKILRKFYIDLWLLKNRNFIILMYTALLNFFFILKEWTSLRAWFLELKNFIMDNWKIYFKRIARNKVKKFVKYKYKRKSYRKKKRKLYRIKLQINKTWNLNSPLIKW